MDIQPIFSSFARGLLTGFVRYFVLIGYTLWGLALIGNPPVALSWIVFALSIFGLWKLVELLEAVVSTD